MSTFNDLLNPNYSREGKYANQYTNGVPTSMQSVGGQWVPAGQVLGASTGTPTQTIPQQQTPSQPVSDPFGNLRSEISNSWDYYLADLDRQFNEYLPQQRATQENLVTSQYGSGLSDLDLQRSMGMGDIERQEQKVQTAKAKSLKDIAQNARQSFQVANRYLGSIGAGDSSAVHMYDYALKKAAMKSQSELEANTQNILGDINFQKFRLGEIYNNERQRLGRERDEKIMQISTWFADAQNQLRTTKASGQFSKSQDLSSLSKDILNMGISALSQVNTSMTTKMGLLEQWAQGNTAALSDALTQMGTATNAAVGAGIPSYTPSPTAMALPADVQKSLPYGYSRDTSVEKNKKTPLFNSYDYLA